MFLKNTINFQYIFARAISVAYKPVILTYLSFISEKKLLNEFSIVFLFSTFALLGSSFSTYRDFYLYKFNKKKRIFNIRKNKTLLSKYLNSLILITIGIIIIFFFLGLKNIFFLKLYIPIILIFLVDKFWDEIQRYLIVKKDIRFWSFFTIAKKIITLISFLISINQLFYDKILFFSILNFILIGVFYFYIIYKLNFDFSLYNLNLYTGCKYVIYHIRFLIFNIVINTFSYLDRIVTYFYSLNDIGQITICSMTFSLLSALIFFFYISEKRKEIIKNIITVSDFLKSKEFYKVLILGYFFCLILSIVFKQFGIIELELSLIFLIGFVQLFYALGLLFIENFFWKKSYHVIITTDLIILILFIILLFILKNFIGIKETYIILNIILFLRILIYLYLSGYKNKLYQKIKT